mmetsp:Transcript_5689/g.9429  ORF Transcript_5689/g.9429 Transcript_5689/m.9429 type:complete len:245 (+) Transcript_5689:544-1278(+)
MMMVRMMASMKSSASTTALLPKVLRTSAPTTTHTTTTRKKRPSNSATTWSAPTGKHLKTRTTVRRTVSSTKRKKSNTSWDHTAPNKEELSSLVFSPTTRALPSLMNTVERRPTTPWLVSKCHTLLNLLLVWSVLPARNQKTTTKTVTMLKTKMPLLRCAKPSTLPPESASQTSELRTPTLPHVTTWKESRLSVRTELSNPCPLLPTRLLPSLSASSSLPLCSSLPTSTTFAPSSTVRPSTFRSK